MSLDSVVEYIRGLPTLDRLNLDALSDLGRAKCDEVLQAAKKTGNERNITLAQVALLLAIVKEFREPSDEQPPDGGEQT